MPEQNPALAQSMNSSWEQVKQALGEAGLGKIDPSAQQHLELLVKYAVANRDPNGPVRTLHSLLGDSWVILVLLLLHFGPFRFSVLQRLIDAIDDHGISRRMLSLCLRALEREGMVTRHVVTRSPLKVEYSLTPLGEELRLHVIPYSDWARTHADAITAARQAFAAKHA